MTQESYTKFYSNEYRDVYGEGDKQIETLFERRRNQGEERYKYFLDHHDLMTNAVIFEIGCDFGTTLWSFAQSGHDVYGCDYGVEHIEYGRKHTGLRTLFIGGTEKLLETGKKADLVILYHVLEHFLNLEKELDIIRKITKPEGIIFIAVPGTFWWIKNFCGGDILSILQNAHTYQFSLRSLKYIMESCGFELVSGNEEIKATFKISSTFHNREMVPRGECKEVKVCLERLERSYIIKGLLMKILDTLGLKEVIKKALSRKHR
jgi:2-polyprenyl-3-methyl-5-hydroxy-6-metoxy-1,4-benzoquinol methylase